MKKTLNKIFSSRIGAFGYVVAVELVLVALAYLVWVITKYDVYGMTWMEYVMSFIVSPAPWQVVEMIIGVILELACAEWCYREWNKNNTENA